MKNLLFLLILIIILFTQPVLADNNLEMSSDIKVFVNGVKKDFNTPPFIINGRTLVPMRAFFEELGCKVEWDNETKSAIGRRKGIEVKLTIGSEIVTVNGAQKKIPVPAQIIDGRTFIPLRFVGEALGEKVFWDNGTIKIESELNSGVINPFNIEINENTIFKGFVENVDYSDPGVFLKTGKQTKATRRVEKFAEKINNKKDLSTIKEIFKAIDKIPDVKEGKKFAVTADELLKNSGLNGCTNHAILFATLSRAKGIPTVFVQTVRKDYITGEIPLPTGHAFVEVLVEGKWYLVDSTAGKIYLDYDKNNYCYDDGYYLFSKSLEVWDTGIKNIRDNGYAIRKTYYHPNFKWNGYKQPKYKYIDIKKGGIKIPRTYESLKQFDPSWYTKIMHMAS